MSKKSVKFVMTIDKSKLKKLSSTKLRIIMALAWLIEKISKTEIEYTLEQVFEKTKK